ncbi:MAG: CHRD domain-containing protein [Bacteroidia bacterium]|nr:CHRD domain-containing protein [Bacteroidia bacterium]
MPNQDDDNLEITINDNGSTTITGVWDANDNSSQPLSNFIDALKAAEFGDELPLYFNIHTNEFRGGEIRGQIASTPFLYLRTDR